ncbi:MAG: SpoIIIAH-like family protein [Clostridia bacterium]|nr:SpoIIIAH-like family protein [Clostridia bacterium]
MKKGKVFGKHHVVLALMVLSLGAAVWLNMKFSSSEKYLGEATFVSDNDISSGEAIQTSAKVEKDTDYFETAKKDREKALAEAQELVEETLKSANASDKERETALKATTQLADRIEKANNIETLLKAKGFEKAVVVIGDNDISVVVKSEGVTTQQTLQIQDIVTAQTKIPLNNIKIITIK